MRLANVYHLGIKELRSLAADPILVFFVAVAFSLTVYANSTISFELRNAQIAIVDQDHSPLTRQIAKAFLPPYFRAPLQVEWANMDELLDHSQASFALVFPPSFERDVLEGRRPEVQLNVDANVVSQAFIGTGYIQKILYREVAEFVRTAPPGGELPIRLTQRVSYNQNLQSSWFSGAMELVNSITMISILLVGAAVLREREHGTLEHLLVMPLAPAEIMLSKVWSNGLVIVALAVLSLQIVIEGIIGLPMAGSLALFIAALVLFLFSTTAIGIYLSTLARSMPQFALLVILTIIPLELLSGNLTPRESMPRFVQDIMLVAPTTHFVRIAQAILFRGAGLDVLWPNMLAIVAIGAVLFLLALQRFRIAVTQTQL